MQRSFVYTVALAALSLGSACAPRPVVVYAGPQPYVAEPYSHREQERLRAVRETERIEAERHRVPERERAAREAPHPAHDAPHQP